MTKAEHEELKKAKVVLCSYCESDMCEWCQVARLIDNADEEVATDGYLEKEDYIERNYSPSCPWNAPGMSINDFI